jgi:TonB family protein
MPMLCALLAWLLLAAQSPGDQTGALSDGVGPRRLKYVEPVYPREAGAAGLGGDVVLRCTIDAEGRVTNATVVEGVPPLSEAAIDAVHKWRYEPTVREGVPVPVTLNMSFRFKVPQARYNDLMHSLGSHNEHLREAAARSLGELRLGNGIHRGDVKKAVSELEKISAKDESLRVRSAAAGAAARLSGKATLPRSEPSAETTASAISTEAASEPSQETPITGPTGEFDSPPVPIQTPRPNYPQDAFIKHVEGTVLIEILIDAHGDVARARILQSVPGLDEEALRCARQWKFRPATKQGQPVATLAHLPVAFHIYSKKE